VDVGCKNIGDEGMKTICAQTTNNLACIQLRFTFYYSAKNSITSLGMELFSRKVWDKLYLLNLCENMLGDKGCKYLSRASLNGLMFL
jgi:hypothetical protein